MHWHLQQATVFSLVAYPSFNCFHSIRIDFNNLREELLNLNDQSFTCQAFSPKLGYLESNEAGDKYIKLSNLGRLKNFQKMSFTWKHEITCTTVEWSQINQQRGISQALQSAGVQKPLAGKAAEVHAKEAGTRMQRDRVLVLWETLFW